MQPYPKCSPRPRGHGGAQRLPLPIFVFDHGLDSIAPVKSVQVDQPSPTDSAQSNVGKKLRLMDWMNRVHGFDFNHHSAFHDQVDSISNFEFLTLINNRQRDFRRYGGSSASEFARQASAF